jgi:hypothetical protein
VAVAAKTDRYGKSGHGGVAIIDKARPCGQRWLSMKRKERMIQVRWLIWFGSIAPDVGAG